MPIDHPKPVDPAMHPLATGNYHIATPASEVFYELVTRCLHHGIIGALIHGLSRIGKTQIVSKLMVDTLLLYGIRNAEDVAICLKEYDQTP